MQTLTEKVVVGVVTGSIVLGGFLPLTLQEKGKLT